METVFPHLVEHTLRILKTVFGKLIVTLPVDPKPTGIEMNHIGWYLMLAQLLGNLQTLFL